MQCTTSWWWFVGGKCEPALRFACKAEWGWRGVEAKGPIMSAKRRVCMFVCCVACDVAGKPRAHDAYKVNVEMPTHETLSCLINMNVYVAEHVLY